MAAINLDIGGNTRQLDRDIQKTVNKVYTINLKTKGDQPLGRITGQVNEFTKSLDASNARVIAFGASAGIIFGLERAFNALVSSTIEVQKSLQDINVILNVSSQQLNKFGGDLFSIAKNTGQSFQEVAKAATEFSRQGLGIQETLKRTSEALILSRLSGLDAAKSVEALTAAVNSFASQSVTATEIVNKFATVDAAFAVSSADLADAISRVGSSASQSGVSLNELIAIVTSAQQTTARGGAVIGNSFKTIFTRLQREKVVDLLESLGISGTDSSGRVKSTIQLLQDLGNVYDKLGSQQQAYVAEQVGGVFQINILKAALADLGKEYSIYSSALNVSAGATDQAIRRNEELNKTYASQINALAENAKQLAATAGQRLLGPTFERVVGGANTLLGGINESDGTGIGATLGKGILDGLGQFISGPGLALIGGVLLKLFRDLGKFATGSVQQLLGLNTAATQQRDLQASIQQILSKNPQLLELALKSEQGLNSAANSLLASLQKQTVELQKQAQVASQISKALISQAGVRVVGGVPTAPTKTGKAAGYIPNFAQGDFAREELLARALGAKNPKAQIGKGTIDGKKFIKNNREVEITGFGSNGDSAVIPNYAKGFIPNFAGVTSLYSLSKGSKIQDYKTLLTQGANYKGQFQKPFGALTKDEANQALARARTNKGQISNTQRSTITNLGKTNKISLIYGKKTGVQQVEGSFTDSNKNRYSATFASSGYNAKVEPDESNLEDLLGKQVIDFVNRFSSIFGDNSGAAKISSIDKLANAGAFRSIAGTIFETAVTQATGSAVTQASRSGGQTAPIDYVSPNPKLRKLFNNIPGSYEAKIGDNQDLVNSVADKAYRSGFFKKQGVFPGAKTKNMASGYIPNFAAIQDAVSRERAAGIPSSQIYLAQEQALTGANPMGLGVFNKQDEPTKGSRKGAMRRKGFATGYIPNFAEDPASVNSSVAALGVELIGLSYILSGSRQRYKESFDSMQSASKATKRFAAGADAYGSAIAIGAPILAATIKNAIPQTTKGGRGAAAAVTGAGQVLSMGATGAQLGLAFGPQGAAVGAALGALAGAALSANDIINGFTSTLPDAQSAFERSSQELTKFNDASGKLTQASEKLKNALSESVPDPKKVQQAQDEYADTLGEFSEGDRKRITSAKSPEEEKAVQERIRSEKEAAQQNAERNLKVSELYEKSSSVGGAGSRLFYTGTGTAAEKATGEANREKISQSFLGNVLQGKQGSEALPVLQALKASGFSEQLRALGSTKDGRSVEERSVDLKSILEKSIPEGEFKADFISNVLNVASTSMLNLQGVVYSLANGTSGATLKLEENVRASNEYADNKSEELRKLDEANRASKNTISIIQQSIRAAQQQASAERAVREVRQKFATNDRYESQLRSSETVNKLVGEDAPLAQRFENRSEIARINKDLTSGINELTSSIATDLSAEVGSLFQTAVQQTGETARGKEGASAGDITDAAKVAKSESDKQIQAFNQFQNILNSNLEGNKDLNFESLKQVFEQQLTDMGIIGENQTGVLSKLETSVNSGNTTIAKLQEEAKQATLKLAKEATQKILIQKIGQAQKFAGGIEEYLNPPKPGESTFDKSVKATQGFEQFQGQKADFAFDYMPGTNQYKYQGREADKARREMAPERGRKALALTGGLQDYFGYTPDASGKASKAGVDGLTAVIEDQIKEYENIAKTTSDPMVREEITAALKEVSALGGPRNIAEIQVAKKTGSLTEEGFRKITGKFNDPVLETLRQQNPELASMKAAEMLITDDPTVKAINKTNSLLTDIRNGSNGSMGNATQKAIQDAVKTSATSPTTSSTTVPKEITAKDAMGNTVRGKEAETVIARDKKRFEDWSKAGGMGLGPTEMNVEDLENGTYGNLRTSTNPYLIASQNDMVDPTLTTTNALREKSIGLPSTQRIRNEKNGIEDLMDNWSPEIQKERIKNGLGEGDAKMAVRDYASYNPFSPITYDNAMVRAGEPIQRSNQNINQQPAAAAQQSFTQQEAALNNNTSLTSTLNTSVQALNSTLTNFQTNVANLNNPQAVTNPSAQQGQNTGGQSSTNIGPFSVVVNQSENTNIEGLINQAMERLKSEILQLVNVKVPPTTTPKRVQQPTRTPGTVNS
jgi:TP901 family phage tail tape measure protein